MLVWFAQLSFPNIPFSTIDLCGRFVVIPCCYVLSLTRTTVSLYGRRLASWRDGGVASNY